MKSGKAAGFFALTILFVFPLIVYGQATSITKNAFDSVVDAAYTNTEKKIRVEITVDKEFDNGTLTKTTTFTQEHLPPDKERWVVVETEGASVERTEIIYTGGAEYRKINNGKWTKIDPNSAARLEVIMDTGLNKRESKYAVEEITEGNEVYKIYTTSTVNYLTPDTTIFSEYKVWIKNGLVFKRTDDSSRNTRDNIERTSITTYDYDPKEFEIKAPVLRKKRKR